MPWESPHVKQDIQFTSHRLDANFGHDIGEIATAAEGGFTMTA